MSKLTSHVISSSNKLYHKSIMSAFTLYGAHGSTNTDRVRLTLAEGDFTGYKFVSLDLQKGEQKVSSSPSYVHFCVAHNSSSQANIYNVTRGVRYRLLSSQMALRSTKAGRSARTLLRSTTYHFCLQPQTPKPLLCLIKHNPLKCSILPSRLVV